MPLDLVPEDFQVYGQYLVLDISAGGTIHQGVGEGVGGGGGAEGQDETWGGGIEVGGRLLCRDGTSINATAAPGTLVFVRRDDVLAIVEVTPETTPA